MLCALPVELVLVKFVGDIVAVSVVFVVVVVFVCCMGQIDKIRINIIITLCVFVSLVAVVVTELSTLWFYVRPLLFNNKGTE